MHQQIDKIIDKIRANWLDALYAGMAAGIAWFISVYFFGHSHPIFASMAALTCLAPGLPDHGKQALYVLIGTSTGVMVGEITLLLPPMPTEIRIALVGFSGLLLGSLYASVPAIINQAGLSAIMVFAMGAEVAGFNRLIDVFVGSAVGLIFSQILFTPNQTKTLRNAVERFFSITAENLALDAEALEKNDINLARKALQTNAQVHRALMGLLNSIDLVLTNARWTLRGWFTSREVKALSVRYDHSAIRLYATTLLFSESLADTMRKNNSPAPDWLVKEMRISVQNCYFLAGKTQLQAEFIMPDRSIRGEVPLTWRDTVNSLELVENILARFYKGKTRKDRLDMHRRREILDAVRAEVLERRATKEHMSEH